MSTKIGIPRRRCEKSAFLGEDSSAPSFDGVAERNPPEVWPQEDTGTERAWREGRAGRQGAGLIDGHKAPLTLLGEKAPHFLLLGELRIAPASIA